MSLLMNSEKAVIISRDTRMETEKHSLAYTNVAMWKL